MKYVHIIDNNLMGWYDTNIHTKIPTPKIEVTDEVWQEALNINANCYENGEFIVKDLRTEEEIAKQELQSKISEASQYLKDTDWVNSYKLRYDLGLEIIPENSSKWEVINQREIYISFLKGL